MSLPEFEYIAPKTVAKAISSQKKFGKFFAGGTDLFVAMTERISHPELLIDLNGISELRGIKWDKKNGLRVGALTTLTRLKENPIVQERFPVLSQIVSLVSTTQLQNMGTLGGNLCLDTRCYYYNQSAFFKKRWDPCFKIGGKVCHVVKGGDACYAAYSGDMAAPLIALEAKVKIAGPNGTSEKKLQDFFTGSGIKPNILKFNEIVTEISIPAPPEYSGLSYQKLRLRDTMDFPILGVALFIHSEKKDSMSCRDVRLVLNAVAPSPIILNDEASNLMCGEKITPKIIKEVSKIAQKAAHPVNNTASSPRYRNEMVQVFTKNAMHEALERIKTKEALR